MVLSGEGRNGSRSQLSRRSDAWKQSRLIIYRRQSGIDNLRARHRRTAMLTSNCKRIPTYDRAMIVEASFGAV
jgi:hypothetical protein